MLRRISAACALALGLTACGFEVEQKAPPVNPNPTDAYRFEVWVEDPPRPMRVESMTAWYGTEHCLPRQPISGVYAVNANFPVPLRPEVWGDNRYAATVFADLLLPSDLYGEGVCLWRLSNVETIWSDGTLAYRQFTRAEPDNGEGGVTYTAFPRDSRGWPERGEQGLFAPSVAFGDYAGEFPSATAKDTSSVYYEPLEPDSRVPRREIAPEADFLLLGRGFQLPVSNPAEEGLDP